MNPYSLFFFENIDVISRTFDRKCTTKNNYFYLFNDVAIEIPNFLKIKLINSQEYKNITNAEHFLTELYISIVNLFYFNVSMQYFIPENNFFLILIILAARRKYVILNFYTLAT